MIVLLKKLKACLLVIAAVISLSACTGVNEKQFAADPLFAEMDRIENFVRVERLEFFQRKNAYALTGQSEHLDRMTELMGLMSQEVGRAEYFQRNSKYYPQGMDYERWKAVQTTYGMCRATLCEMMLEVGELKMRHGDKDDAVALFGGIVAGFPEKEFSRSVHRAEDFLQQINDAGMYAKDSSRREVGAQ
jgi:TolA-binding protein